jgi:hypothetical protein
MPIVPNVASGNSLETLLHSFLPWEPPSGFTSFIPRSKDLRTKHAKRLSVNLRSSAISPLGAAADPSDCSLCLIWLGETSNLKFAHCKFRVAKFKAGK